MKATLYAKPHFQLCFTPKEADVIINAARHHYDHTCRATIVPGGFLNMMNQLRKEAQGSPEADVGVEYIVPVTWRELDLLGKLLEPWIPVGDCLEALLYHNIGQLMRGPSRQPLFVDPVAQFKFEHDQMCVINDTPFWLRQNIQR